jgi:hypothetical protein
LRTLSRGLAIACALILVAMGAADGAAKKRPVSFTLDAPNGAAQWSTVLTTMEDGERFNLYVTPLEQHLGGSVYATEIQVHLGPVALGFARMDPSIINPYLKPDEHNKLPPIWEMCQIVGETARPIEDPRTMALGAAAISLEDGRPALIQAYFHGGRLDVSYRPSPRAKTLSLGQFRVAGKHLPVRTRVIGYKARFQMP